MAERLHLLVQHLGQLAATAGVIAGPQHAIPQHAIGVVGQLLEGHGPNHVGPVAVVWARGQPGQEMAHQNGQRPEDLGIPVIAGHGRTGTGAQIPCHRPIKPQTESSSSHSESKPYWGDGGHH